MMQTPTPIKKNKRGVVKWSKLKKHLKEKHIKFVQNIYTICVLFAVMGHVF